MFTTDINYLFFFFLLLLFLGKKMSCVLTPPLNKGNKTFRAQDVSPLVVSPLVVSPPNPSRFAPKPFPPIFLYIYI